MQFVAVAADGRVVHELGSQRPGKRIDRRFVEIGDAVEESRSTDKFVKRLALFVLLGETVIGIWWRLGQSSASRR